MKKIMLISNLLIFLCFSSFAQPMSGSGGSALPNDGNIIGKIIEDGSNVPLEYATVAIYSSKDSSLVDGAIANADGIFRVSNLKPGSYYLNAKFIGYTETLIKEIEISRDRSKVDLGILKLKPATENISEVKVVAKDRAIAYEIDKKVIDPSQFPTAANGTAVDILANTPSVTVDVEGNVSLRGSSSFTVLIDGRPTPFDPADALAQIPASVIRNIEIITNPSAKYDPDGNAGIININTKKSKINGFSGLVNATGDTNGSITGDLLLNYRVGKFNFFVSGNRGEHYRGGTSVNETMTIDVDTVFTNSYGETNRSHGSSSLKTGFDYTINDYNSLAFNIEFGSRSGVNKSTLNFEENWSSGYELKSLTENKGTRDGTEVGYSLDYKKTFAREGQELTAMLFYQTESNDELSAYNQYDVASNLLGGQKNWEVGSEKQYRVKIDYIHPFNTKSKLEAGYQSRIDREDEWNDVHWYTTPDTYEPSESSAYYNNTIFSRDIHAAYATFNQKMALWGYQLGLRTEYTNRIMSYTGSTEDYVVNRLDFFPTVHTSFNLPSEQQMTASYSRRIQRPRGYYLEPFLTYTDAYNVRTGNPGILPEYIDSYEMGYQKPLGTGFFSAEAYFRQTNNKIERVQSVYASNVMMSSVANVGTDYSLGMELMLNYKPTKWWVLNVMGNLYNYRLTGEYNNKTFNTKSFNWDSRLSNTFLLGKTTKLQLDGMYHSPTVTAQGRREGFMFTNLAVRQDFFDNKFSATLGVRDVLNTAKFEFKSEGTNFSSYRKFDMKSPIVSITLSYKINNYKQKNKPGQEGENGGGMMDMNGGGEM